MSDPRPKLLVVCGPTATGKTALAIQLAQEFGGEIVNADSMQVYRHMDVGTAKPTAAERDRGRFHLIDVVDPDDTFSAGRFRDAAMRAVGEIVARGALPIVAGGTGLYLKALTRGLWDGPAADRALRAQYKQQERDKPGSLYRRLQAVDPDRAEVVHPADTVRIERALEVYDLTGRPISEWQRDHGFSESPFRVVKIGLSLARDELAAAVDQRVDAMIANGWLAEVRRLRAMGYGPTLPSQAALGYRELHQHLDGVFDLAAAVAHAKSATRKFAKRQRTWFGADETIAWFDARHGLADARQAAARFAAMG